MIYKSFEDLPLSYQSFINELVGETKSSSWVSEKIPALENKSVLTVMNEPNGKVAVAKFLQKAGNLSGIPLVLGEA